jgi:hypothetical protein
MATIEFSYTVTAENKARAINGVAYQNHYQDEIEVPDPKNEGEFILIPNPENKGVFCRRMIREYIINCVTAWEANQAAEVARLAAIEDVVENMEVV